MSGGQLWREIIADTRQLLETVAAGSRRTLMLSPEVAALLEQAGQAELAFPAPSDAAESVSKVMEAQEVAYEEALEALAAEVAACNLCSLCETRTQTVFGVGNPASEIVFVGEAPGAEEDRQGKPFVGRAGQLLTDIIVKGMKMRREDVYICNVLKCRPPENRDPNPEEVCRCEAYLLRQLDILRPKVICALGKYAAQTLLKSTAPVSRLRGQWWRYHDIPLRVTFHPAYLLRNPNDKRLCWDDIQEVMKVLNGEIAP